MSKTLLSSCICAAGLILMASPALAPDANAQMPTNSASYSGDISIAADGQTLFGKMYRTPSKMRMELDIEGTSSATIIDFQTGMASSVVDVGMGQPMVMSVDTRQYGVASMEADFSKLSPTGASKVVSGMSCSMYREAEQNADICMTSDGIMLEAVSPDSTMRMSNVVRGPQAASLFAVPAGGMDLNSMMGDAMRQSGSYGSGAYGSESEAPAQESFPEELAREMKEEAERESKRKAKKKARKLLKDLF